jgi:hypothetical protein
MLIKQGVDISRLMHPIRSALAVVQSQMTSELIITSTYEGTHLPSSLHYANMAFDYRKPYGEKDNDNSHLKAVQAKLGPNYTVLLEKKTTPDTYAVETEWFHCQCNLNIALTP